MAIHSDSAYTINAATKWRAAWQRSNFKDNTLKNRDLVEQLWGEHDSFTSTTDKVINFYWVKAHVNNYPNEQADQLAKEGAMLYHASQ